MKIGDRTIDDDHPAYLIAEIGVNHDGSLDKALRLIELAGEAGADAVKFQHFNAERLMSRDARLAGYQREAGESDPVTMLDRLAFTIQQLGACVECAHANDLHAIVSVFSVELVEETERLAWDAYKSASPDIVHRPLLVRLAETGRPLIVSTGAAHREEVQRARGWLEPWHDRIAFLHCVSSYPTPPESAHVSACADVRELVEPCPVGYSDHTTSIETGFAAVRCGARLLEKHFTDDREARGPDHGASLDPPTFQQYAWYARLTGREAHDTYFDDRLLGVATKRVHDLEHDVRTVSRQSIVTAATLRAGETIDRDALTYKRPGTGFSPDRVDEVIGRTLARDVEADRVLTPEDLA